MHLRPLSLVFFPQGVGQEAVKFRRLFSLVVLLVLVGAAIYVWRGRPAAPAPSAEGRDLKGQARALGAQARDKLGTVGQDLRDLKVTASVKTAFLNRNLRPYSIDVSTQNGVVTLRGRVDGEELRARAEAVAAAVPDVTRVQNQLVLDHIRVGKAS